MLQNVSNVIINSLNFYLELSSAVKNLRNSN